MTSFTTAELTGVLSVYLYISRHKHAYRKKVKRLTNSSSGNGNGNANANSGGGGGTGNNAGLEHHLQLAAVGPVAAVNDLERTGNNNNNRSQVAANHYVPLSSNRSNGRIPTGSVHSSIGDNMVAMGGGAQAAVVVDGSGRQFYQGAFAPVLRQGPAAAAVVGLTGGCLGQSGSGPTTTTMRERYIVDQLQQQQQQQGPVPYYALAASGRDLSMMAHEYGVDPTMAPTTTASFNGSAIMCRGSPVGSAVYRRSMDSLLLPSDHMSLCGGMPGGMGCGAGGGGGGGDLGRRTTPV